MGARATGCGARRRVARKWGWRRRSSSSRASSCSGPGAGCHLPLRTDRADRGGRRREAGRVPRGARAGPELRAPGARLASAARLHYPPRVLHRLPYDGAIDADGHILEPPDLWDRYLEPRWRDRPLGVRKGPDGLEYLEIAGKPSKMVRKNLPAGLGAMDLVGNIPLPPRVPTGLKYLDNAGLGAWDAKERLERLDRENLAIGILPAFEPFWAAPGRFGRMTDASLSFLINVTAPDAVRHAFTSFFQFGVFDKFPRLKVVVLESGAGWIGYWLERMDAVCASPLGRNVPLREKPSLYFRRQCRSSCDPDH